jgi:hypothetical protein
VQAARDVPVGPFSGVSAARGTCVVSGGTSALTVWRYDSTGTLTGPVATADLGRGQPDVVLAADGQRAFVSTHYWGVTFGLDIVPLRQPGAPLAASGELRVPGAGFTEGGAKPANFPIELAEIGTDTVVMAYARGLAVIGTAGDRPILLAHADLGAPAVNVDAADGRVAVVVAGPAPGLVLLDFPAGRVRIIRRIALDAGIRPVAVILTHSKAAVAARGRGVLVFDL